MGSAMGKDIDRGMKRFLYIAVTLFWAIAAYGQERAMMWSDTSHATNNMRRSEMYIESKYDGLPISVIEMVPEGEPKAVVYLVHGLCGCKERFLPFMEYLTANGIASDHRGHGSSIRCEADRGYMYQGGVESIVMDMDVVVDYIKERYAGVKLVMLGHSMGSLAARAYTKTHDARLDALIICGSPAPNPLAPIGRAVIGLMGGNGRQRMGFLQKFTSRRYNRKFRDEGYQAWTCSDPEVRKAFADDPRCNFTLTADCASTLLGLFEEAYSKKGWITDNPQMPVLFLSGDDDACMISMKDFLESVDHMRQNGYKNVTSRTYPGMRHEILNEKDKMSVWNDIISYIRNLFLE